MRTFSAEALAALDAGGFTTRCLLRVDMPDDEYFAIWDDIGQIVADGVTYEGAPGRFTVQPAVGSYDDGARPCTVTLPGLDSEVVAFIMSAPWHQRPVLIQRAIVATEAPQVLHLSPEFSGRLDKVVQKESPGGTYDLQFLCETEAIENSRSGARTRSDADQRQRDPDDGFFSFSTSAKTTTIDWGRSPQQAAPKPSGIAKFLDKIF